MTKKTKITLKMSFEESAAVMLALIESQKNYTNGPAIPERIISLREVIQNLDTAMEDAISSKAE